MPHETNIFKNGAHWRFFGALAFQEVMEANDEVWSRDDWDTMEFQIADFLAVDELLMDEIYAKAVAEMDNTATKDMHSMRVALVAAKPEIIAICKTYAKTLNGSPITARIFSNLEEANAWAKP